MKWSGVGCFLSADAVRSDVDYEDWAVLVGWVCLDGCGLLRFATYLLWRGVSRCLGNWVWSEEVCVGDWDWRWWCELL